MGIVTWPEVDNVWWIRHALDKQLNLIISIIEVKVGRCKNVECQNILYASPLCYADNLSKVMHLIFKRPAPSP